MFMICKGLCDSIRYLCTCLDLQIAILHLTMCTCSNFGGLCGVQVIRPIGNKVTKLAFYEFIHILGATWRGAVSATRGRGSTTWGRTSAAWTRVQQSIYTCWGQHATQHATMQVQSSAPHQRMFSSWFAEERDPCSRQGDKENHGKGQKDSRRDQYWCPQLVLLGVPGVHRTLYGAVCHACDMGARRL